MKSGRGFRYVTADGEQVRDDAALERIRSLAIPPAWTDVWISPRANGHLQATGRDARGRKQFRYHARWTALRDENKYSRLVNFSKALPKIRRRVSRDLRRPGLDHDKVVATIVRLMERTFIRVGNEEYARQNGSYGLTTLRNRHAKVKGDTVHLFFKGKGGKEVEAAVSDRRVARVVRRLQELPGQELFEWVDPAGVRHSVSSQDVNEYLRAVTGEDITAKDFRTWAGTVLAATALKELAGFESTTDAKRRVISAIDRVARRLGNTRAVARRSYVHPAVVDSYMDGSLDRALTEAPVDAAVLRLLRRRGGRSFAA